jgi:hypothetical protein
VSKKELRTFLVWSGVLVGLIGLSYWLGWKSPWARADMHVRVEAPDAVRSVATIQPAAPTATMTESPADPPGSAGPERESDSATMAGEVERPRRRSHGRRSADDSTAND